MKKRIPFFSTASPATGSAPAARPRFIIAAVFIAIFLFYFIFLPVSYNFDGTVFSQILRYSLRTHDWLAVVQAHHLLYFPLNYLLYRLLELLFHYQVLEFFHLQLFSMLFGLATLLVIERMLNKLGLPLWLRMLGVVALAFSIAFWQFSVDAEVHMPGVFFVAAGLYILLFRPARLVPLAGAALCFVLAAGFHLTNGLIVATVFFYLLSKRAPWRSFAQFYISYAGFLLILYGAYSFLIRQSVPKLLITMLFGADVYSGYHVAYAHSLSWPTWRLSLVTLKSALVSDAGIPSWAVLAGILVLLTLSFRQAATGTQGLFKRAMLFWALPFFLFFTYWDPGKIEFKIHITVPLLLIATLSLYRMRPLAARLTGVSLAIGLLWINLVWGIKPQADIKKNTNYQIALAVGRATPANAQILITGTAAGYEYGKIYLPYFAGRDVLILDWVLGKGHALPEILSTLKNKNRRGQPAYTLDEIAVPGKALTDLLRFHRVPEKDIDQWRSSVRFVPVAALPGDGRLYRLEFILL
jgi:hypothetical protein